MWYGLSPHQVEQLEAVDRLLLRKILDTPISTPIEGIQLELGVFSIGTIIKARRIIFLHYLLTTGENEMMSKVFWAQWKNPAKNDWTEQVKDDLNLFKIEPDLKQLAGKSQNVFKKFVKVKAAEYEFRRLMNIKQKHSKMDNLNYSK